MSQNSKVEGLIKAGTSQVQNTVMPMQGHKCFYTVNCYPPCLRLWSYPSSVFLSALGFQLTLKSATALSHERQRPTVRRNNWTVSI